MFARILPLFTATTLIAAEATNRFGFVGPEIFPIDNQVSELNAADLDGDGKQDLIVVNNFRAKINLLYNYTGRAKDAKLPGTPVKREINELPPDARFRIDSVASEKRIVSLDVVDLNGDGRPDLAYYGEPKELVVQYNQGTNNWSLPKRWPIEDGQLNANMLVHGDLNGDGRTDLMLLGESTIYVLYQTEERTLGEPEKIPFSGQVRAMQILDINGDRKLDLLLVNWDNPNPFRFRLQTSPGQFSPEMHFSLPPVRSYHADDLDGDGRAEIVAIALNSGRAQVYNFRQKNAEALQGPLKQGQFQVLPLNKTDKARRGAVWADVNKDQLSDLLVAEPGSGQLSLYVQQASGELATPKTFPTLTGINELSVMDWDGDGTAEIFLLSTEERQMGVTRLEANGRIPFPTIIAVDGRPLSSAVGSLQAGAKPSLVVIVDQDGKRSLLVRDANGASKTQKLAESFKSNPASVTIHDVNQDGLPDLVVLIPYEKIKVLLQTPERSFTELDIAAPGGAVEQPWLTTLDVDGDGKAELLLAQKNFLRAVVLQMDESAPKADDKPAWAFRVKEQINGAASNSRIVGAAALPQAGGKVTSLFLLDAERKVLSLAERDASGVWQTLRNVSLPVMEFGSLQSIAVGGPQLNSIAFLGLNSVGYMAFAGKVWEMAELDGYETPINGGYLMDVVSGDLNNDGRKDLVFLETARNHLDIVTFESPGKLVPSDRWQVFEERTFRNNRGTAPEPREALIVDITGDGKKDLVIIVHDRVLVYPQE